MQGRGVSAVRSMTRPGSQPRPPAHLVHALGQHHGGQQVAHFVGRVRLRAGAAAEKRKVRHNPTREPKAPQPRRAARHCAARTSSVLCSRAAVAQPSADVSAAGVSAPRSMSRHAQRGSRAMARCSGALTTRRRVAEPTPRGAARRRGAAAAPFGSTLACAGSGGGRGVSADGARRRTRRGTAGAWAGAGGLTRLRVITLSGPPVERATSAPATQLSAPDAAAAHCGASAHH